MGSREDIGRNDPCPCGSGKKYKRCCLGSEVDPAVAPRNTKAALIAAAVAALVVIAVALTRTVNDALVLAVVAALVVAGVYIFSNMPPPNENTGSPGGINFGG